MKKNNIIHFNYNHKLINTDNLLGLNNLLHNYQEKIDCIIIDPPYNTGNDNMIYFDNFKQSEWISFMKERLLKAKELLSAEGVIFIHINNKELFYLKILLDEIFEEKNFIENFIWVKNSIKNNSSLHSNNHEYILCYAKDKNKIKKLNYFKKQKEGLEEVYSILSAVENNLTLNIEEKVELLTKKLKEFYKNNKNLKGINQYKFVEENNAKLKIFRISDVSAPNKKGNFFNILHPITGKVVKNPAGGYRYNEAKMNEILEKNLLYFGKDEKTIPQYKRYLEDVETEAVKSVIENFDEGYKDLEKIIPNHNFNNPKPVSLIKFLLTLINKDKFFILDFFAGSGTIGQAVNEINIENKKEIVCLAITNNENNICESITKLRFEKTLKDFDYFVF